MQEPPDPKKGQEVFLIVLYIFFRVLKDGDNRTNEHTADKIADPVDKIPRQSRGNPCYHTLKIKPKQNRLSRGVKRAKQKSVQGADRHVNNRASL